MIVGIEQLTLSEQRADRSIPKLAPWYLEQVRCIGQISPVIVRKLEARRFEILSNVEAWLAVQQLGQHLVEILVRDDVSDDEVSALVNSPRSDDPIAEAHWFRNRLDGVGEGDPPPSIAALARTVGVSRSYIAHALRLLTLDPELQEMLRTGRLKVGHGKALLTLNDANDRHRIATQALHEKWSVRRIESEARSLAPDEVKTSTDSSAKSASTMVLERKLTGLVGSDVTIDETGGTLQIDYGTNLDVLDGILRRLGYSRA